LREQVSKVNLKLEHCRSEEQAVDFLTKVAAVEVFKKLRGLMEIEPLANMN